MATQQAQAADQTQDHRPLSFEDPDDVSDIVLVVEERKLHLHRQVLMLHSPVFKRMLLSDFKEKDAREIPLPGKNYDAFLQFLLQMYPVSSLKPITDKNIVEILALADEYQVEHIRRKCEQYIESQLTSQREQLTTDQKLLYFWMSDAYGYQGLRSRLVDMAAETDVSRLQASSRYSSLPLAVTRDVMLKRCEKLERENKSLGNDLYHEKQAHTRLQERMKNWRSSIEKFLEKFSIRSNCSQGAEHKTQECDRHCNKEQYCTFCASKKARETILKLLK